MFQSELNDNDKIQLIGQILLKREFKDWFLFFFKLVEGKNFDIEPIHQDLFDIFSKIEKNEVSRQIINISPRSAKTTLSIYFIAYCFAKNPFCQFIYTSYSQDLLNDNSRRLANILTNELYIKMYLLNSIEEEQKLNIVDDFWSEYLKKDNEFKITSRKITTKAGGVVLFASIGSQITGFGFGDKNRKGFNGCLIIDDGDKPSTIRSIKIREKTHQYYTETLLTRANNSLAPIINIQQRLHVEDLSGFLIKQYNFNILKKPLMESNGNINLPKQYTEERIEELKKDNYVWLCQYQQEPIKDGGNIIKSEWFIKNSTIPVSFDYVYITCDTAFSTKTSADNSVMLLCGIKENQLFLLDCQVGKFGMPELKRNLADFYYNAKSKYNNFSSIYIENKASGQSLIQEFQSVGLPVEGILPTIKGKVDTKDFIADKYTRLMEVITDISNGYVNIPIISNWQDEFLAECEAFTGNGDTRDDRVDTLIYALKVRRRLLFENKVDWAKINNSFFRL